VSVSFTPRLINPPGIHLLGGCVRPAADLDFLEKTLRLSNHGSSVLLPVA
jgi:hypothetical protein